MMKQQEVFSSLFSPKDIVVRAMMDEEMDRALRSIAQAGKNSDDILSIVHSPERVIFSPPATVVFWRDGTKTVVRCDRDEFSEEFGFAMACMRKIFGSRHQFKRQFKNAQRPYLNACSKKKKPAVVESPYKSEADNVQSLDKMLRDFAKDDSMGVQIGFRETK